MEQTVVSFQRTGQGRPCYCHIADLATVREIMRLNRSELARMLFISRAALRQHEEPPNGVHRCLPKPCLALLLAWMHTPPYTARLLAAGFPIPTEPPLSWCA